MKKRSQISDNDILEDHAVFKTEIAVMKNEITHIKEKVDSHDLLLKDMAKDLKSLSEGVNTKIDEKCSEVDEKFAAKWVEKAVYGLGAASASLLVAIVLKAVGLW